MSAVSMSLIFKPHCFGSPQTCGIKQHQQRAISQVRRSFDKPSHFLWLRTTGSFFGVLTEW